MDVLLRKVKALHDNKLSAELQTFLKSALALFAHSKSALSSSHHFKQIAKTSRTSIRKSSFPLGSYRKSAECRRKKVKVTSFRWGVPANALFLLSYSDSITIFPSNLHSTLFRIPFQFLTFSAFPPALRHTFLTMWMRFGFWLFV